MKDRTLMKAVQLTGIEGLRSLTLTQVERPTPGPDEVLFRVKAAGVNFAELEMIYGRYPSPRPLPAIMGFEAAGEVIEVGANVENVSPGDRVTAIVSSGGYAEYAVAPAANIIPIPEGVSFAEASTITVQGLSAYAILKLAAQPQPHETILVQAAAGGVGLYLVQLAKIMGAKRVIALASSGEKLELVKSLGADVAVNYAETGWTDEIVEATGGAGVDILLESISGKIADECFRLVAPFGRVVMYGAKNANDILPAEKVAQLIHKNQTVIGFNIPSLLPEQIAECVPGLLQLIASGRLKLFARNEFRLEEVATAFEALASRNTIGKVVLIP